MSFDANFLLRFFKKTRKVFLCTFTGKMWVAETTYFLSLILTFALVNSELRNISSDKVTLK